MKDKNEKIDYKTLNEVLRSGNILLKILKTINYIKLYKRKKPHFVMWFYLI